MQTLLFLLVTWISANVVIVSWRLRLISRRRHSIDRWPYSQPVFVVIDRTRPE